MRSTPFLRNFLNVAFESSNFCLTDDGLLSSFQGRSSRACLLQAINGVMSLVCNRLLNGTEPPKYRARALSMGRESKIRTQQLVSAFLVLFVIIQL